MKNTIRKTLSALLLFTATVPCLAADSMAYRSPQVILVQLRSEHNRIQALTRDRQYKKLEEVKKDAIATNAAMISDFSDHIDYCPVYYYMDTNLDFVKDRQFAGILMDASGNIVKDPVLKSNSRNYFIIFYGFPTAQSRTTNVVKDPGRYRYNSGEPMGRGLIINNYKFEQVSFIYKFGYEEGIFTANSDKKYIYHSRHFDIEYFPLAEKLNKKLRNRQGKIRITHVYNLTDELFDYKD